MTLPSGDRVMMLVRYDDVIAALTSPASSRRLARPGLPRMVRGRGLGIDDVAGVIINLDPPDHTRYRRILSGVFSRSQVERWRGRTAGIANELVDGFTGEFDVVADYALQLSSRVICHILGVPQERQDRFHDWTDAFLPTSEVSVEARQASYGAFRNYVAELIASHRSSPGNDLIDLLIRAHDHDDRLTEIELINTVFMLLAAGHETLTTMISRGVYRLLLAHDQWDALVTDPGLVEPAVEEILRFDGPGSYGLLRLATDDIVVASGVIPAGRVMLPNPYAADHDPSVFPDPGRFDIRRFTTAGVSPHLAFGHGPHYCLGANPARMELQEGLRTLVKRLPNLRPVTALSEVEWTADGNHRPARLPVLPN
ncbi:MAG: cytochrome P450 [Microbispora sp.]|nr:cytochrome P450 [Microbispora sp.]